MMPPLRRRLALLVLVLALLLNLTLDSTSVAAELAALTHIRGQVVDSVSRQPLHGAQVFVFTSEGEESNLLTSVGTNASGIYEVVVDPRGSYRVYACCDLNTTLGVDYVPGRLDVSVGNGDVTASFALVPGATILLVEGGNLTGRYWMKEAYFDLYDRNGPLYLPGSVWTRRGHLDDAATGLSGRAVVVPARTPVKVLATILIPEEEGESAAAGFHLWIDEEGHNLNLSQGGVFSFDLEGAALQLYGDSIVKGHWESAQALAGTLVNAGFPVAYEKTRLLMVESLVESGCSSLNHGDHEGAYACFHEASLVLRDVERSLESMLANAPQSVFFLLPLLGLTGVALASILLAGRKRRVWASLVLYGAFSSLLLLLYPGSVIAWAEDYRLEAVTVPGPYVVLSFAAASYILPLFLLQGWPRLHRERPTPEGLSLVSAIAVAFSIASRSMRRRRLHTVLTSSFITAAVFAFTLLTSLSLENGLSVRALPTRAASEGLLIRRPLANGPAVFQDLEPEMLEWFQERPGVVSVAVKLENAPRVVPASSPPSLGVLFKPESSVTFSFSGVLGVYPGSEVNATRMDDVVVQGSFLDEQDLDGMLISEEAADELDVGPNSMLLLYGRSFRVTGLFSDEKLNQLVDLDGASLVPQYVSVVQAPGGTVFVPGRVPSNEVVIMHAETAKSLPLRMVVSRVDLRTQNYGDIMAVARLAVLTWPGLEAFAGTQAGVQHVFIGSRGLTKGFIEALVPLAIVTLNVSVIVLGTVYERRREVAVMSCVGLNPTHITAIFVAEALVVGLLAGTLGYLSALATYRPMIWLSATGGVRPKVEVTWGIGALFFSIAAATIGFAVPARKASIIATPSLTRRWELRTEERPREKEQPWLFLVPIQLRQEDVDEFFSFVAARLREDVPYRRVDALSVSGRAAAIRLSFVHTFTYGLDRAGTTQNELFPVASLQDRYSIRLACKTPRGLPEELEEAYVRETATLVRQLVLRYSHLRELADYAGWP